MARQSGLVIADPAQDTLAMKALATLLVTAIFLFGCGPNRQPPVQAAIAACRGIPRVPGHYEQRARCELEVESQAYLASNPEMAGTWSQLISSTLDEYALADRGEQTIAQADANATLLREAAETGTGCLSDGCGAGSKWRFPDDPPY